MIDERVRNLRVDLVGNRRFWVVDDADLEPLGGLAAIHGELAAQFVPDDPEAPLGVCVLVPEKDVAARPEATWSDPRAVNAGRTSDGTRLWLAYFEGAVVRPRVAPPVPLDRWLDGAESLVFDEQDVVSKQDVLDLWAREGAMPADVAAQRVDEVFLVAVDEGRLVGVSTTYLAQNAQLGLMTWYARAFVATSERRKATAGRLIYWTRVHRGERFESGRDTRAPAVVLEVENPMLRAMFPEAVWAGSEYTYIGTNQRDDDVRVFWFPGARVPW